MLALMPDSYHVPVMLQECLDGLKIKPDGIYVDLTFGGGGHSIQILERLTTGHLYAFDQDPDVKSSLPLLQSDQFHFIEANFRYIDNYLKFYGVEVVDGIIADLGVSSHQIDSPERGFSTRYDARLDMRMDQSSSISAVDVLNKRSEAELVTIFSRYGEIRNSRTLAREVVKARANGPLRTVAQLNLVAEKLAPSGRRSKYLAQVYQALRIEVNQEMTALEEMLIKGIQTLTPGGRFVVMSYHSLEDRLVKSVFNSGAVSGIQKKDFYGNLIRPVKPLNRKPISASADELARNPRARSAKLRIAEKL